ncbi:MAG: hypothetical protein WC087_00035 [Candidatus Paceibacterota bacterium]
MFGGFKKSKTNSNFNLLISLRGQIVSLALIENSDKKNKINFLIKETILKDDYLLAIENGVKKIISEGLVILSQGLKSAKIKDVEVVLSAPFYDVYIKDLLIEKESSFILTKDQFNKAIQKHSEIINAEKANKIILEKDVTNVMINGYSLQNPFNKEVKKLDVSFYASFIEKKIVDDIEKSIKKSLNISDVKFKTYTLNKFNAIRNTFLNVANYISIDVGEKYTDVFVVENNALKYRKFFEIGSQQFISDIADKCSVNPQIVASEISMMMLGELTQKCNPEIEKSLSEEKKKWVSNLISEMIDKENIIVPPKVFLSADKKISNIFVHILSDPDFKKDIFGDEKNVMILNCDNKHFTKDVVYKDGLESDIFITINSINLNH